MKKSLSSLFAVAFLIGLQPAGANLVSVSDPNVERQSVESIDRFFQLVDADLKLQINAANEYADLLEAADVAESKRAGAAHEMIREARRNGLSAPARSTALAEDYWFSNQEIVKNMAEVEGPRNRLSSAVSLVFMKQMGLGLHAAHQLSELFRVNADEIAKVSQRLKRATKSQRAVGLFAYSNTIETLNFQLGAENFVEAWRSAQALLYIHQALDGSPLQSRIQMEVSSRMSESSFGRPMILEHSARNGFFGEIVNVLATPAAKSRGLSCRGIFGR